MTGVLPKKGSLDKEKDAQRKKMMYRHTEKRSPHDWNDALRRQGTPRAVANTPSWKSGGGSPYSTFISDLQPPELGENKFLLF